MSSQLLWTPGLQGTAEQLNGAALWKVADIAALKAVDTTNFGVYANDRDIYVMVRSIGLYRYDLSSTLSGNDSSVIAPTTGSGRWILESASSGEDTQTAQAQIGPLIQEIDALKKRVATIEAAKTSWVKQIDTGAISIATVTEYDHLIEIPDFTLRDTDSILVSFPFPPPTGLWILAAWMHLQTGQIYVRFRNNSGSTITINACQLTVRIERTN